MVLQKHTFWHALIYGIGVVASVYHLANGVWTSLITWGITIGPRSQRMAGYACTAFGVALSLVGLGAMRGFATYDTKAAPPAEQAHTAAFVEEIE